MRDRRWELGILAVGLILAILSGVVAYSIVGPYGDEGQWNRRVRRVFNEETGEVEIVIYDLDGDLRFDTWSHMDGDRAVRTAYDIDRDGRVDRWEYFRADGTTVRLDADTDGNGQSDWRILFDAAGMVTSAARLETQTPTHRAEEEP